MQQQSATSSSTPTHLNMKFFAAFAVLAAVASAAPSAYTLETREDKCLPQRIAVVVLDNSHSTTFADTKNLRQEVARKVFAKMTDKGAFICTEFQGPAVFAARTPSTRSSGPPRRFTGTTTGRLRT